MLIVKLVVGWLVWVLLNQSQLHLNALPPQPTSPTTPTPFAKCSNNENEMQSTPSFFLAP